MTSKFLSYSTGPSSALIVPSPTLISPLLDNEFLTKLVPNVSKDIPKSTPIYCFALFLTVLLTLFINKLECSRDLTTFITSSFSSFKINIVLPFQKFVLNSCICC